MDKYKDELAYLYKNAAGSGKEQAWSLAQPNLDHRPLTQDQIREESMKYLTREQKRHFELNTQLNKRGSLFGPRRDGPREKAPAPPQHVNLAEEETGHDPTSDDKNLMHLSATSLHEQEVLPSMSVATTRFLNTYDSVRGSEITEDMRLLGSMMPMPSVSNANFDYLHQSEMAMPSMSQVSMGQRKRTLDLVKGSLFRIDDWIKMEEKGEYLGKRKHFLRVINTLDYDEKVMQVSNYQVLKELVDFYAKNYNSNAHNYVWKDIWGNTLNMYKSLGENGLPDHSLVVDELGLDHFPTILIYFKDGFEDEPLMRLDISKPEPDGIKVPCRNY